VRHAWLTEQIKAVHVTYRGTYGSRRVHAELTLGLGITVGQGAVEMLMCRGGIKGLPGNRRPRPEHLTPPAGDLVHRQFTGPLPDRLWVTGITEHSTRQGKGLLRRGSDSRAPRRRWSACSSQIAPLVTSALDMTIGNRTAQPGVVIHSDWVQFMSWAFTDRARACGLLPWMGSIGEHQRIPACSMTRNPASRLRETQGTSKSPPNPGRFTKPGNEGTPTFRHVPAPAESHSIRSAKGRVLKRRSPYRLSSACCVAIVKFSTDSRLFS
jgi:transposase InsO family protein